jgi:hypothetical protein
MTRELLAWAFLVAFVGWLCFPLWKRGPRYERLPDSWRPKGTRDGR